MTGEGWRPLFAEAAGFLGLSPEPVMVAGVPGGLPSRLPAGDAAVACVATALTAAASNYLTRLQSDAGPVTEVTPPGTLDGRTLAWPPRLDTYGQDRPTW